MQRLIIVSNRLPVTVEKRKGELSFKGSVGGVATGLGAYHKTHESLWVGWADTASARMDADERDQVRQSLLEHHSCAPVFLTPDDVRGFYHGFSNRTLWPLFHQFTQYVESDHKTWAAYERVNKKYRDAVLEIAQPGDTIWIQDYQLMLLPQLLREAIPDASIGFFLHIPFPSYEVFRMLPWRSEILEGLLGADLFGFHTYDYVRHFLSGVRRLLGTDNQYGRIDMDGRLVLADAFPMGIDYDRYAQGAQTTKARREVERVRTSPETHKTVLSIDRLDYTKGIPRRLEAFAALLEQHPEWRGRVTLVCVAVPSRTRVEEYRILKARVDELVGRINGTYGTIEWTPVNYLYRSLPFHVLVGMYVAADVALVTPLRDGMNLIAKEYLAARGDTGGVLVLSEMAGAAGELHEALQVNPYDPDAMVEALVCALDMPLAEQKERNASMQQRLKRYTVQRWAEDFLGSLENLKLEQLGWSAFLLDKWAEERLVKAYRSSRKRLFLLDYDGTLVNFAFRPDAASPPREAIDLLKRLGADERNEIVVISGRERESLESFLGTLPVHLVAEHGVWLRGASHEWVTIEPMSDEWKPRIRPFLELYVDRTPGSFVEEKDYSLAWHYRGVDLPLAARREKELRETLMGVVDNLGLAVMEGNKVIEVKAAGVNKGQAAHRWMCREEFDFVFVAGDDRTDEDTFEVAPESAWTVKVGHGPTRARFSVRSVVDIRRVLTSMMEADQT